MQDDNLLELNCNSDEARTALHKAFSGLPQAVDLFLVGGAVRNALFRIFHGQVLTQRDYDQVITRGSEDYKEYLAGLGYVGRPYPSHQDKQVAYSKALNEKAQEGDSYVNWLVFDMHTVDGTTIEDNLKYNVAFTINGCAVKANDLFTKPWQECLIQAFPSSLDDIKNKKLQLNYDGYKSQPSYFYSVLRFMSAGFAPPPKVEVDLLLHELPRIEHARFERNVKKVYDYVGGEEKARSLVKSLGIDIDVFDEAIVKSKL